MSDPFEDFLVRLLASVHLKEMADAVEREVKFLEVDLPAFEARLAELPHARSFQGDVASTEITAPDIAENWTLKYRTMEGRPTTLILKGAKQTHPLYKVRREITWELQEPLSPAELAVRLDGAVEPTVTKARRSYEIEDGDAHFHVDIDQDPDIGLIVEVEGERDDDIVRATVLLRLEKYSTSAGGRSDLLAMKRPA